MASLNIQLHHFGRTKYRSDSCCELETRKQKLIVIRRKLQVQFEVANNLQWQNTRHFYQFATTKQLFLFVCGRLKYFLQIFTFLLVLVSVLLVCVPGHMKAGVTQCWQILRKLILVGISFFWHFDPVLLPYLSRDPSERSTKYHSAGPAGVHAVLAAAGGGRRHAGGRHTQPHLRGAAPGQPGNSNDDIRG